MAEKANEITGGPKEKALCFLHNLFCGTDRRAILFSSETVRAGQQFGTLIHRFCVVFTELFRKTTFKLF